MTRPQLSFGVRRLNHTVSTSVHFVAAADGLQTSAYDPDENAANRAKHGISFDDTVALKYDTHLDFYLSDEWHP